MMLEKGCGVHHGHYLVEQTCHMLQCTHCMQHEREVSCMVQRPLCLLCSAWCTAMVGLGDGTCTPTFKDETTIIGGAY